MSLKKSSVKSFLSFHSGEQVVKFHSPRLQWVATQRAAEALTLDFKCIFLKDEFKKCQRV